MNDRVSKCLRQCVRSIGDSLTVPDGDHRFTLAPFDENREIQRISEPLFGGRCPSSLVPFIEGFSALLDYMDACVFAGNAKGFQALKQWLPRATEIQDNENRLVFDSTLGERRTPSEMMFAAIKARPLSDRSPLVVINVIRCYYLSLLKAGRLNLEISRESFSRTIHSSLNGFRWSSPQNLAWFTGPVPFMDKRIRRPNFLAEFGLANAVLHNGRRIASPGDMPEEKTQGAWFGDVMGLDPQRAQQVYLDAVLASRAPWPADLAATTLECGTIPFLLRNDAVAARTQMKETGNNAYALHQALLPAGTEVFSFGESMLGALVPRLIDQKLSREAAEWAIDFVLEVDPGISGAATSSLRQLEDYASDMGWGVLEAACRDFEPKVKVIQTGRAWSDPHEDPPIDPVGILL